MPSQRREEAGGSPNRETPGRVASSPDNDGAQWQSWAPPPSIGSVVNVGTTRGSRLHRSSRPAQRVGASSADGLGWGGGPVVVRGRESRPHGEGPSGFTQA